MDSLISPINGVNTGDIFVSDSEGASNTQGVSFTELVGKGVDSLNSTISKADSLTEAYALENADIQDVMLAMEEAKMTMQLAVTVRNKAVDGIQELLRMQL